MGMILEVDDSWCCVESLAWEESGKWVVREFPTGNCLAFGKPSVKKKLVQKCCFGQSGIAEMEGGHFSSPCVEWSWTVPHLGNAGKLPLDDTVSSLGKYHLSTRSPLSHRPEFWPWLGIWFQLCPSLNRGWEGAASESGRGLPYQ